MSKPIARRVGSQPRIEPQKVRKLFEDSGLGKADFALLAGASVRKVTNGGWTSNTVKHWLDGDRLMAADTYDLLVTRIWLLKHKHASFSELINEPLKDILIKLLE